MKIKEELYPKVSISKKGYVTVFFWFHGKRFRYANGNILNEQIFPNHVKGVKKEREAEALCSAFTMAIRNGWRPEKVKNTTKYRPSETIKDLTERVLERKLSQDYSPAYKYQLQRISKLWLRYLHSNGLINILVDEMTMDVIADFIHSTNESLQSMRYSKKGISALLKDDLEDRGVIFNHKKIKLKKPVERLHRPIENVNQVLKDIKAFNSNLHLCCLLTYTMLLRPHREIRCLRFSDFNEDFTTLRLSGARVKSKRNRVIPVPDSARAYIMKRYELYSDRRLNIFSGRTQEYNRDYFKTIWTKYKSQTTLLTKDQTLYSFRHSASMAIYEKTGSLLKLQQVMGHSDMKVSLTYLRGLEVKQLDVEDLPEL